MLRALARPLVGLVVPLGAVLAAFSVGAVQVYHWEVVLEQIIDSVVAGSLGGEVYTLTLANGGLVIEYNDAYGLDSAIQTAAETTTAGIAAGSITTGV